MKRLLCLLAASVAVSAASAQVLMLDFGPTVVSGTNRVNSPLHTVQPLFSGSTWNRVQTADIPSGLVWADNSAATALSLDLGATTAATTSSSTLLLSATPSGNSALGGSTNTGIYEGTSVGTDGIFTSTSGNSRAVGFQLTGLTAGTYDVYVTARNTSTSNAYSQTAFVGTSAAGNFVLDGPGMFSESLSYSGSAAATTAWTEGENYFKFTITLTSGEALNVATLGSGSDNRGFLNAVQIVTVPEPGGVLLLGLAGITVLFFRRGRRMAD